MLWRASSTFDAIRFNDWARRALPTPAFPCRKPFEILALGRLLQPVALIPANKPLSLTHSLHFTKVCVCLCVRACKNLRHQRPDTQRAELRQCPTVESAGEFFIEEKGVCACALLCKTHWCACVASIGPGGWAVVVVWGRLVEAT